MSKQVPLPTSNIGRRRTIISQLGQRVKLVIEDEIVRRQSTAPNKAIVFQKIRFEEDGRVEFRFGYYMIGRKAGAKGRWVWGQYALLIPKRDLRYLLKKAQSKGWF